MPTSEELVRALHTALPDPRSECAECGNVWPCATIRLLDLMAERATVNDPFVPKAVRDPDDD